MTFLPLIVLLIGLSLENVYGNEISCAMDISCNHRQFHPVLTGKPLVISPFQDPCGLTEVPKEVIIKPAPENCSSYCEFQEESYTNKAFGSSNKVDLVTTQTHLETSPAETARIREYKSRVSVRYITDKEERAKHNTLNEIHMQLTSPPLDPIDVWIVKLIPGPKESKDEDKPYVYFYVHVVDLQANIGHGVGDTPRNLTQLFKEQPGFSSCRPIQLIEVKFLNDKKVGIIFHVPKESKCDLKSGEISVDLKGKYTVESNSLKNLLEGYSNLVAEFDGSLA